MLKLKTEKKNCFSSLIKLSKVVKRTSYFIKFNKLSRKRFSTVELVEKYYLNLSNKQKKFRTRIIVYRYKKT